MQEEDSQSLVQERTFRSCREIRILSDGGIKFCNDGNGLVEKGKVRNMLETLEDGETVGGVLLTYTYRLILCNCLVGETSPNKNIKLLIFETWSPLQSKLLWLDPEKESFGFID